MHFFFNLTNKRDDKLMEDYQEDVRERILHRTINEFAQVQTCMLICIEKTCCFHFPRLWQFALLTHTCTFVVQTGTTFLKFHPH